VRFSCDNCGRSYLADEKVRNRAFRMKCKQCGNVIVVKPASLPTPAPGSIPSITQLNLQAVELETAGADAPDPFATMAAELSQELAHLPEGPPIAPPDLLQPGASGQPAPPTVYPGVPPLPPGPRFPEPAAPAPKLSESDEAFADLSRQIGETGERPLHVHGDDVLHAPPPQAPPRPTAPEAEASQPRRRWVAALVGLSAGGGVAALLVYLLANSGPVVKLAGPAPSPAPVQAPAAAPAPSPAAPPPAPQALQVPAPAPSPAAAALAPQPSAVAAAPVSPAPAPRERPRREVRRAEPATAPAPAAAAPAPAARPARQPAASPAPTPRAVSVAAPPATSPVNAPPAAPRDEGSVRPGKPAPPPVSSASDQPLDEKAIESTVARSQAGFEQCVAQARKSEPQLVGESRRITVTMTVNPNGKALYPTLDDALLNSTELGSCLKREAGKMAFPEFAGEPVRVRVPLVLR
jgi:DNA-directed RNA polymerase subunit RPC12/RpoP